MDDNEFKVYQLIRQHYLAQFLPLYKEENTTITLHHSGNTFIAKGKKLPN